MIGVKRLRRIAWNGLAAMSTLLCVATALVWIRSYYVCDGAYFEVVEPGTNGSSRIIQNSYSPWCQSSGFAARDVRLFVGRPRPIPALSAATISAQHQPNAPNAEMCPRGHSYRLTLRQSRMSATNPRRRGFWCAD